MDLVALDKKNLKKLVGAMLRQAKVIGPVNNGRETMLAELTQKSELDFDYANFKLPLKREFFPQSEVLSRYDANGAVEEAKSSGKTVIFGVRPCDAQSLSYLDKIFVDERYADPYYKARRDNALVITLACENPAEACFCGSTGGGPASKAGADIIAFNLGESLLFEACSPRGENFLKQHKGLFRQPAPKEIQKRKQQESNLIKQLSKICVSDVPKALKNKNDALFWNGLAETCLSCGACTYLCPTCHCFDLFDEKLRTGGKKLRVHDACMFASFTREASGHNPREKKGDRMRQRVMHKFSYAPENYHEVFCVGCGRCIVNCPSNIDIREILSKVIA